MSFSMPDANYLTSIFQKVDTDRSGAIDSRELQSALSNGNWTPFNPDTVKLMIGMFDKTGSGTINFDEFGSLWKYVTDWQNCFRSYDKDRSGSINTQELSTALTSFGYTFSPAFYETLMTRFDRTKKGQIYFDDFIQCCVMLHTLTDRFRSLDKEQGGANGVISMTYEQFMAIVLPMIV